MASAKLTQAAVDLLAAQREQQGSQSRSTSAGSSSSPSMRRTRREKTGGQAQADVCLDFEYPLPPLIRTLDTSPLFQELEYPSPVIVKNTFLDSPVDEPTSLDGFFKQREIHSCPPGAVAQPGSQELDAQEAGPEEEPEPEMQQTPFQSYVWEGTPEPAAAVPSISPEPSPQLLAMFVPQAVPPPPAAWAPCMQPEAVPPPPMAPAEKPTRVVRLAEAMAAPQLGSEEAPTIGSLGHKYGNCKPCAFMHTKGCTTGVACQFCHLCDKNERKRRQKQKHQQAARQALLQQQQERHEQQPRALPLRVSSAVPGRTPLRR